MDHLDSVKTVSFSHWVPFSLISSKCQTVAMSTFQEMRKLNISVKDPFQFHYCSIKQVTRIVIIVLSLLNGSATGTNFTAQVFEGDRRSGLIAAFGDFNSDKLTDTFVISEDRKSFGILLSHEKPPYLRNTNLNCTFGSRVITSLVPGDFDGDAAMDVAVMTESAVSEYFDVHIVWGNLSALECRTDPLFKMFGQPLMLDYNQDMIADLFGLDENKTRSFWIFGSDRSVEAKESMNRTQPLRQPHSHSFVDLNGDMAADLLLTGENDYEIWSWTERGFVLNGTIDLPVANAQFTGQSVFIDVNFDGVLDHLVPVCVDRYCSQSSLFIYHQEKWTLVECNLDDWTFMRPEAKSDNIYRETITARSGDVNLDGYPDLLMTLTRNGKTRAVLMENVPSPGSSYARKFQIKWNILSEWNDTIMATFYDIQQKGVMDVLMIQQSSDNYRMKTMMSAYKNDLDYDANFIKVLVLTGRCYGNCTHGQIPYGTNLPGPFIGYRTTNSGGLPQEACSTQLYQSAYHSLQLPYSLFGLGHTPNFVETLLVGVKSSHREWTQIIPNSQMIIIPNLSGDSSHWLNKLFVTPSRAIVLSAAALIGFGTFLALLVVVLHVRERRADKREQSAIAYRFHFDAM